MLKDLKILLLDTSTNPFSRFENDLGMFFSAEYIRKELAIEPKFDLNKFKSAQTEKMFREGTAESLMPLFESRYSTILL